MSGSCSVVSTTFPLGQRRLTFRRIALSSVCITSRITVRRDHALIRSARSAVSGWRAMLTSIASGWVPRPPASVISANNSDCESAPWP